MRRTALLWLALLVGCGARTPPAMLDEGDASLDASLEAAVDDGAIDAIVAPEAAVDAASSCPARRPLLGETCDDALEGRSCAFGIACEVECVCERGSWVCANDTCADRCPDRVPAGRACAPREVDRECTYPTGCPVTCRCDGERWSCASPPC